VTASGQHPDRATIRPYRPTDRSAVGDVCIRTADAGADASQVYAEPGILPELFAYPYVELEPELAFVLDDGSRPVGYVLGTRDTAQFADRWRVEWLPRLTDRYPLGSGDPTKPDAAMVDYLHHPERMLVPELTEYPAHLHIDILPAHQGAGHGRQLISTFLAAASALEVPGVHLAMLTDNRPARAFYDRLGFHELDVPVAGSLTYLGVRL
jgi:ribosomal protein S18 acetylase RimI-like enzyme